MTDKPHTPTTREVIEVWEHHSNWSISDFDRWLAQVEAAAEQRGAVRAFNESANEVRREMRWQYEQNINRNSDTGDSIDRLLELEKVFKYRAAQMEAE